ncbi:MAG: hypothetical protein A3I39_02605 [Candidatus Yanofskybacteria bacterium RIFCSPLOWO2_02_FULL_47_9b]|uniref:Uncharacterized protein n=1 Tax=Candidatus Yanofskybacteria bacterium RIFCSPLOWO2_02_FULL_47_9b TaxID=1802708 RepID=A0A1F8H7E2_9BACT|nr:MAG: hypothetical protein A3I39_02605 [Candidatus Yanofskybacteria bacterium RIFCSPLOWO2_02_FULL_47_9b]
MDPKRRLFRKLGENANWEPVPKGDGLSVEDLVGAGTDRGTLGEVGVLEILRRLNDLRPDSLSVSFEFRDTPRHLFMRYRKEEKSWSEWRDTGDPSGLLVLSGYDTRVGKEQDLILVLKNRHLESGYEVEYEFRDM